jgi:hypothetical protein
MKGNCPHARDQGGVDDGVNKPLAIRLHTARGT